VQVSGTFRGRQVSCEELASRSDAIGDDPSTTNATFPSLSTTDFDSHCLETTLAQKKCHPTQPANHILQFSDPAQGDPVVEREIHYSAGSLFRGSRPSRDPAASCPRARTAPCGAFPGIFPQTPLGHDAPPRWVQARSATGPLA